MKAKFKNLTKNTLLFGISSFGTKFLSFFLVYLYTKELSVEEYGTIDVITTTVQLLIPVLTLNIQDAILRFGFDDNCNSTEVLNIGMRFVCGGSVLLGIVLCIWKIFLALPLGINYCFFLYFSFVGGTLFNVFSMYLKVKNYVKTLTVWSFFNTVVTFGATIVLLGIKHLGVNGYIIATISGLFIANIGMFFGGKIYEDLRKNKFSKTLFVSMIAYSGPLIVNTLGWWINTASDRYILTYFYGASINGIYAVAYKIPSMLAAVQSVFYNAWSISAIKEYDANDSDGFIGNVYSIYAKMSILIASFIMVFNIIIAKLLYSNEFFEAWRYVPILMIGTIFNGLGLFEGCIFTAVKRTKEVSVTTILGALINTVLNLLLIPMYGANGAAVATVIGYFTIWLMRTIKLRNFIKLRILWKQQIFCMGILLIQAIIACLNVEMIYQLPFLILIIFFCGDILRVMFRKRNKRCQVP